MFRVESSYIQVQSCTMTRVLAEDLLNMLILRTRRQYVLHLVALKIVTSQFLCVQKHSTAVHVLCALQQASTLNDHHFQARKLLSAKECFYAAVIVTSVPQLTRLKEALRLLVVLVSALMFDQ